jgi:hypothetical protein
MYKQYECFHCDAVFKVKHDLDENYQVYFCPFCGGDIEEETEEYDDE